MNSAHRVVYKINKQICIISIKLIKVPVVAHALTTRLRYIAFSCNFHQLAGGEGGELQGEGAVICPLPTSILPSFVWWFVAAYVVGYPAT